MDNAPSLRTKLTFWLLLGFLSVAIAEVTVASAPFAFVDPFETVLLTTFYGSHLLVFAWLAFRQGWPSFRALWLGGVLFGLYEFYITKVLWAPPWGDTISLAHIDVISLIVLALFWHPFMAFILPLAIGETVGASSRWVSRVLPSWLTGGSRLSIGIALAIAALLHGLMTGDPAVALVSTASALAAVLAVAWWWRRHGRNGRWDLRDLLPTDRQGKRLAALLLLQYVIFIPLWNTDSIPPLLGHVVVWLFYAGFALLFRGALGDAAEPHTAPGAHPGWSRRRIFGWIAAFVALSVLGSLGQPDIGAVAVFAIGVVVGLRTLTGVLRAIWSDERRPVTAALSVDHDDDPAHKS